MMHEFLNTHVCLPQQLMINRHGSQKLGHWTHAAAIALCGFVEFVMLSRRALLDGCIQRCHTSKPLQQSIRTG
jgi:hypothetical protein